jgi:diguanylate cyclase (GGDEF)-like protein
MQATPQPDRRVPDGHVTPPGAVTAPAALANAPAGLIDHTDRPGATLLIDACAKGFPIVLADEGIVTWMGGDRSDLMGHSLAVLGIDLRSRRWRRAESALRRNEPVSLLLSLANAHGEPRRAEISLRAMRDASGCCRYFSARLTETTPRASGQPGGTDALTGLPSRHALLHRLRSALRPHAGGEARPALLLVNMDLFRSLNDCRGHDTGDQVLTQAGRRLASAMQWGDSIARLSGDEFVVLMPSVPTERHAGIVAERLLELVARPYTVGHGDLYCSCSIGIALAGPGTRCVSEMLGAARAALIAAKRAGRNAYQIQRASEGVVAEPVDLADTLELRTLLSKAIEGQQFSLVFQPQVDTATRRVNAFETLIRWQHPRLGAISPVTFIPVAEDSGQIMAIGAWVLDEACRQFAAWRAQGCGLARIAVNVSGQQLRRGGLFDLVSVTLHRHGMQPHELELEITESVTMEASETATRAIADLRRIGVRLAIDDFGTGFSSLSYLKRLPVNTVKIDRSFVRDLDADSGSATIARGVISIAHRLGLRVVAEGVETEQQIEFLRRHGCDEVQGYLIARPMSAAAATAYLGSQEGVRAFAAEQEPAAPAAALPTVCGSEA